MNTVLFLSYRREDTLGQTSRLYDRLIATFGEKYVFCDKATLKAGDLWEEKIREALSNTRVLLAIIGKDWGGKPLHESSDYVRFEIVSAFKKNITVIPVLVNDADLPTENDLPSDLKHLRKIQAIKLSTESHDSYNHDVERLIRNLLETITEKTDNPSLQ